MDIHSLHGGINSNSDKIKKGEMENKASWAKSTGLEHTLEKRERRNSNEIHGLRTKTTGLQKDMDRIEKYGNEPSKRYG